MAACLSSHLFSVRLQTLIILFIHSFIVGVAMAQEEGATSIPNIPDTARGSPQINQFLSFWDFSLQHDNRPQSLRSTEPKSLFIPGDRFMVNLVPQDGAHPLYLRDPQFVKLRREFILDHLIEDTLTEESLKTGVDVETLTGKVVKIATDPSGQIWANDVKVNKVMSKEDGTHIFLLDKPLFDSAQKVRDAFYGIEHPLFFPIGPPLNLDNVEIRNPENEPQPPAPPSADDIGGTAAIRPPAPPRHTE